MITIPPCAHCAESKTALHCGNPQCDWFTCLNCRRITVSRD